MQLPIHLPVRAANGGLFVSRGRGRHPARVLESHELIVVSCGHLGMREGKCLFDLGPGDALLLSPGREHEGTAPYPTDLAFYWLHFSLLGKFSIRDERKTVLDLPTSVHLPHPERVEELLTRFLNDQDADCLTPGVADLLLLQILAEISDAVKANNNDSQPDTPGTLLASRAKQMIRSQSIHGLSTASLARQLHCNPDYLGRRFKAVYHITILEAIHQSRVARAKELLTNSPLNSQEVALASGFRDDVYFRRIFKRHTGISPLAFRRLHARRHVNTA